MSATDRYNREWEYLVETVRVSWPDPAWAGCHRLDQILARIPADPDAVLGALVQRAQRGDRLAGRIVVQAMLGKLVRMAARDATADVDDYAGSLWEVIARYPLERRPSAVAAGLALDTLKTVVAARPGPAVAPPQAAPPEPDAVEVLARAQSEGFIDADTRALLHAVYVEGLGPVRVAADLGLTAAAVRQRCSRALRTLAAARLELAA